MRFPSLCSTPSQEPDPSPARRADFVPAPRPPSSSSLPFHPLAPSLAVADEDIPDSARKPEPEPELDSDGNEVESPKKKKPKAKGGAKKKKADANGDGTEDDFEEKPKKKVRRLRPRSRLPALLEPSAS